MTDQRPAVWVAKAFVDSRNNKGFEPIGDYDIQTLADLALRIQTGKPVSAEEMPDRLHVSGFVKTPKTIPPFLRAGPYPCVSDPIAQAMLGCDLGQGNLYPIRLFKKDKVTEYDTRHWFLNIGNVKAGFEPSEARGNGVREMKDPNDKVNRWAMSSGMAPDSAAIRASALNGPDIWVDPMVVRAVFVSDRMRDALVPVGGDKALRLVRCRVLQNH